MSAADRGSGDAFPPRAITLSPRMLIKSLTILQAREFFSLLDIGLFMHNLKEIYHSTYFMLGNCIK